MRLPLKALALALVVSVGAVVAAFHHAGAQDGNPDATGTWAGRLLFKDHPMEGDDGANKGAFDATLTISQEGFSIVGSLSVDTEEGLQVFSLFGAVGNGNLWLHNGDDETPMLLTGTVKGEKIKFTGVFVDGSNFSSIKCALKKQVISL